MAGHVGWQATWAPNSTSLTNFEFVMVATVLDEWAHTDSIFLSEEVSPRPCMLHGGSRVELKP